MPAFYALGQHDGLEAGARQLHPDDFVVAYLDDLYVRTTRERAKQLSSQRDGEVAKRESQRSSRKSSVTSAQDRAERDAERLMRSKEPSEADRACQKSAERELKREQKREQQQERAAAARKDEARATFALDDELQNLKTPGTLQEEAKRAADAEGLTLEELEARKGVGLLETTQDERLLRRLELLQTAEVAERAEIAQEQADAAADEAATAAAAVMGLSDAPGQLGRPTSAKARWRRGSVVSARRRAFRQAAPRVRSSRRGLTRRTTLLHSAAGCTPRTR